jgi:predicted extracellular nuclease
MMGKTTLRILYLNAENLFSPNEPFYNSPGYSDEDYLQKINWISSIIAFADVDVVALTEIGDNARSCIDDIVAVINVQNPKKAIQDTFIARPCAGWPKIRAAVLSRFSISDTGSLASFPRGFKVDLHDLGTAEGDRENWVSIPIREYSRPVAKARINPPNNATPFNLFVVHLKSKRPTISPAHDGDNTQNNEAIGAARAAIRRNMEAAALRVYLNTFLVEQFDADNKIPTIVLGDFNETPTSVPLENIRGPFDRDPGPSSPWTRNDKLSLLTCARLHLRKGAYEDKLYSYIHEESFSLIDQVLVTKHLIGKFKHMEVLNDHVMRHQELKTSVTDDDRKWKSIVSDHGAVVLEFTRMLRP